MKSAQAICEAGFEFPFAHFPFKKKGKILRFFVGSGAKLGWILQGFFGKCKGVGSVVRGMELSACWRDISNFNGRAWKFSVIFSGFFFFFGVKVRGNFTVFSGRQSLQTAGGRTGSVKVADRQC